MHTRHPGMLPWLNDSLLPSACRRSTTIRCRRRHVGELVARSSYSEEFHSPAHAYYRTPAKPEEVLDPAIMGLPVDRPFVLATLGSNTWVAPERSCRCAK